MAKQVEQFLVEQTNLTVNIETGEWASEAPYDPYTTPVRRQVVQCTKAAFCSLRALEKNGFLTARCFPSALTSMEAAEEQEKACMAAQEATCEAYVQPQPESTVD